MLEPNLLFEFSRQHCVAICSFLVPAILLATGQTLILLWFQRSQKQMFPSVALASIFAVVMFFHVSTWFIIGIVTPVTFILSGLGMTCLIINLIAITYANKINFREILLSKFN